MISIHTPAKGVTFDCFFLFIHFLNFNPHSREGSDSMECVGSRFPSQISIHTPAKGVTIPNLEFHQTIHISIHTPAKGVTNPQKALRDHVDISIHTPAKGVTHKIISPCAIKNYFNPHSREGSDQMIGLCCPSAQYFNPHSREGSDVYHDYVLDYFQSFQSTLPRRE